MQKQPAVRLGLGNCAFRLHKGMIGHGGGVVMRDDMRGFAKRLVHIAPPKLLPGEEVAALMQNGRALGERFHGAGNGP